MASQFRGDERKKNRKQPILFPSTREGKGKRKVPPYTKNEGLVGKGKKRKEGMFFVEKTSSRLFNSTKGGGGGGKEKRSISSR